MNLWASTTASHVQHPPTLYLIFCVLAVKHRLSFFQSGLQVKALTNTLRLRRCIQRLFKVPFLSLRFLIVRVLISLLITMICWVIVISVDITVLVARVWLLLLSGQTIGLHDPHANVYVHSVWNSHLKEFQVLILSFVAILQRPLYPLRSCGLWLARSYRRFPRTLRRALHFFLSLFDGLSALSFSSCLDLLLVRAVGMNTLVSQGLQVPFHLPYLLRRWKTI
mmetsp:Transcript_11383/g.41649  ORF Transcript_11383/g.41649 Transcript_11383/m.41649 type:complete len:223 (-) Transcript_11383:1908-2576(-)